MRKYLLSIFTALVVLVLAVGCSNDTTETDVEEDAEAPVEQQEEANTGEQEEGTIAVTISLDHGEEILSENEIEIEENDILLEVMKEHYDIEEEGGFINSIDGVAPEEGEEKSWMYFVNDEMPMVGAAEYELSVGDQVEFDLQPWE